MATFTGQVTANADDGQVWPDGFSIADVGIGYDGGYNHVFARFLNVTIPKNAIITGAHLQYKAMSSLALASVQTTIYANNVVAPTSPTSDATFTAKALTTASVNWDAPGAWVAGTWYDSPELTSIIQEIVNQASWASGNAILILHKNRRATTPNCNITANGYENGSANAPKLVITYTVGGVLSFNMSEDVSSVAVTGQKKVSRSFAMTNASSIVTTAKKKTSKTFAITHASSVVVAGHNRALSFALTNASSVSITAKKKVSNTFAITATNAVTISKKKISKKAIVITGNTSSVYIYTIQIGGEFSKRIKLYDANETSFTKNGLGILSQCTVARLIEELNGSYEVELEHPMDDYGKYLNLVEDHIIKADNQLFRIYYKKRILGSVNVKARHIFYDLIDYFLEDMTLTSMNGAAALDWMLTHTHDIANYPHGFRSVSDVPNLGTWAIKYKNPVEAIMGTDGIIEQIGGEIERDNFTINLHNNRGADRGVLVAYRKNITGIEETLDTSGIVTRILPVGKDGLKLTTQIGTAPIGYIDSPYIDNYPHPKVVQIDFSDIDNVTDLAIAGNDYILNSGCDIPQFNYKVDFVELTKTEEYKDYAILETVYMGDTVTVKHSKLGLNLKARVIKIEKNLLTDRIDKIELGAFKPNIANNINKAIQAIRLELVKTTSDFEIAVANATQQITGALGGNLVIRQDEAGKPYEMLIMDTTNIMTAQKVWRWNIGGLGYSTTGVNGPYTTAITQDGSIVATFITSGILNGSLLKTGTITSTDGSLSINLANGAFTIGGGTGDVSKHTDAYSKWMHGASDYTIAQASGLMRHAGSTNRDYHYLIDTGEKLTSDANSVLVTVDPAFKGKKFVVTVSVMDTENPTPYIGETMVGYTSYVDEATYDYANGTVEVYGWGTWYDGRQFFADQHAGNAVDRSYISGLRLAWTAIG